MKKRILIFLLCFLLVFTVTVSVPQREADAFLMAFTPEAIAVAAGLLTAAGITFATSDSARAAAYNFLVNSSQSVRDVIVSATTGAVIVTSGLWQALRSFIVPSETDIAYVDSTFSYTLSSGQSIQVYPTQQGVNLDGLIIARANMAWNDILNVLVYHENGTGYTGLCVRGTRTWQGSTWRYSMIVDAKDKGSLLYSQTIDKGSSSRWDVYTSLSVVGDEILLKIDGQNFYVWTPTYPVGIGYVSFTVTSSGTLSGEFDIAGHVTIPSTSYVYDERYWGNSAWSLEGKEVTVPTSLGDVVGKSAEEVISNVAPVAVPPDVATPVGEVTGWLANIYQAFSSALTSIRSIADTLTTGLIGDMNTVSLSPVATAVSGIQYKFPFSIPWDLKTAWQSLYASSSSPPEIHTSLTLVGVPLDVDIVIPSTLTDFVVYVRWFLLFAFDLGLLWAFLAIMGGQK